MTRDGRALAETYPSGAPRLVKQRKTRFDSHHGIFHSEKTLVEAFKRVRAQLNMPLGDLLLTVKDNAGQMEIYASTSWHEKIGEFPTSYHQVDLLLKFTLNPNGGLLVTYDWVVTDFPRSPLTNRLIRTVNIMVAAVLMLL